MAVEVMNDSQLHIEYNVGVDEHGEPIIKNKNYNNLKTTAAPNGIQAVAQAIAGLQQHALASVQRNSNYEILAE
ncbi:DUF1659 domain-containing protein [Calidifontibacillus oryziterrae]|uniref:DUF1659 domain-containing protein n=1 Tax=Calidifontibacillus oryziterrae TaxID=1191699 RepID=UPI0002D951B8|nr:DUF1659 domain-containing protein [Calidifontibacillus oryziterrae]